MKVVSHYFSQAQDLLDAFFTRMFYAVPEGVFKGIFFE
jgi:hypothetical protein